MLFTSYDFLVFFPIVVLCYYIIPIKYRWIWLLGASYYFYICWNPIYIILLCFTTVITYCCGILLERMSDSSIGKRKMVLWAGILINFAVLFWFKYFNFFSYTINGILARLSVQVRCPENDLMLPLGISFFTFQAVGYVIDVYRNDVKAEKNVLRYALFVSFFVQIAAGPIERAGNMLPQFRKEHRFDYVKAKDGLLCMLWGFS